jgi:hypothetical protein
LAIFCCLAPGYCSSQAYASLSPATLNTALSPHVTQTQLILIIRNCISTYFFTLWPVSGLYSNWSVFGYCMLVSERKCAEITFTVEESVSPVKHKKIGESVTVLP